MGKQAEVKRAVIQSHHIRYPVEGKPEHEYTVRVRKSEHLLLTRLSWYCRKTLSEGFVRALDIWLAMNRHRAEKF